MQIIKLWLTISDWNRLPQPIVLSCCSLLNQLLIYEICKYLKYFKPFSIAICSLWNNPQHVEGSQYLVKEAFTVFMGKWGIRMIQVLVDILCIDLWWALCILKIHVGWKSISSVKTHIIWIMLGTNNTTVSFMKEFIYCVVYIVHKNIQISWPANENSKIYKSHDQPMKILLVKL